VENISEDGVVKVGEAALVSAVQVVKNQKDQFLKYCSNATIQVEVTSVVIAEGHK